MVAEGKVAVVGRMVANAQVGSMVAHVASNFTLWSTSTSCQGVSDGSSTTGATTAKINSLKRVFQTCKKYKPRGLVDGQHWRTSKGHVSRRRRGWVVNRSKAGWGWKGWIIGPGLDLPRSRKRTKGVTVCLRTVRCVLRSKNVHCTQNTTSKLTLILQDWRAEAMSPNA